MFVFMFYTIIHATDGTVSYINCPLMRFECGFNFSQILPNTSFPATIQDFVII